MSDTADPDSLPRKRSLKLPILVGLGLALAGGGGSFWAVTRGPFAPTPAESEVADEEGEADSIPQPDGLPVDIAFIELEPLVIPLGSGLAERTLIFGAQLEVTPSHQDEVLHLAPRVVDVMNGYLRVITVAELSDPTALSRLRAQLLRRIQVVTGTGRVRDLLITQFVVN